MKLKNNSKPPREPIKGGTYYGVCVHAIDIGEQKASFKGGYSAKFLWTFELFRLENFKMVPVMYEEDGVMKPFDLSITMNNSNHMNSNVAKHLSSWLDDETVDEDFMEKFDTNDVVGHCAMLKVVLKENGYNDIKTINALPEGFPVPEHGMELIRFDMDPWDQEAFDELPDWAKRRIQKSVQYQKQHAKVQEVSIEKARTASKEGGAPF